MKILFLIATLACLAPAAFAEDFPVSRCINLGNALDSPNVEGEWGYVINEPDLDWVAAQGFDTVRLPVRFSTRWDGAIDPVFLARVDQVIGQAQDRGLRVILDLHHFEEIMSDPKGQEDKFLAIWAELASHYAGAGPDLIFELLNEPSDQLTTARATALYAKALPMIRKTHPDRWIIVGGGDWSGVSSLAEMPAYGPREIVTFHFYDPYPFTHQQAGWLAEPPPARGWGNEADRAELAALFQEVAAYQGPLFLGEFGSYEDTAQADRNRWTNTVIRAAEAQGIGWCVWAIQSGFRLRDPQTGDWLPGMQEIFFPAP